jgi:hypothetical protein
MKAASQQKGIMIQRNNNGQKGTKALPKRNRKTAYSIADDFMSQLSVMKDRGSFSISGTRIC